MQPPIRGQQFRSYSNPLRDDLDPLEVAERVEALLLEVVPGWYRVGLCYSPWTAQPTVVVDHDGEHLAQVRKAMQLAQS